MAIYMPPPQEKTLKMSILRYLEEWKTPVPLAKLYDIFPGHTPNGIRVTIYKLRDEGFVEKVSRKRPVTYKAV